MIVLGQHPNNPVCCGMMMVVSGPGCAAFLICQRGGCHKTLSYEDWFNGKPPSEPWLPSVPHPLLQLDTALRRAGRTKKHVGTS
jgi:hypothetical protein